MTNDETMAELQRYPLPLVLDLVQRLTRAVPWSYTGDGHRRLHLDELESLNLWTSEILYLRGER